MMINSRERNNNSLLELKNLTVRFRTVEGVHNAVRNVDLRLQPDEALGIVGESGSGKSVTALSIMQLIPNPPGEIVNGQIIYNNKDLLKIPDEDMRNIRGNDISMIFQEPMTSLNPIHTCGRQIMEPLLTHQNYGKKQASERVHELMQLVGIPLPAQRFKEYPHQLSGGMRQRIMIAMALACRPKLLLADEPTTALDVTIQAQILDLMMQLRQEINTAIILITHDLGIVAEICDRVAVMYAGQVVENNSTSALFTKPYHPYTEGLLRSIPKIGKEKTKLVAIEGTVPSPFNMPVGCSFQPRCSYAMSICKEKSPDLYEVTGGGEVRCWRYV